MIINLKDKIILNIPTQIGCPINCSFCVSSQKDFVRSLTSSEIIKIIDKSLSAKDTLISFTGEGEAILNLSNVNLAISHFDSKDNVIGFRLCMSGFNSKRLESLISPIKKPLDLQVSLHSPFDSKRLELIQHTDDISDIFNHIRLNHFKFQSVSINYVLIEGFNDTNEDLYQLKKIIQNNWHIKLNPLLSDDPDYIPSSRVDIFFSDLKKNRFLISKFHKIGSNIKNKLFNNLTYIINH